RDATVTGVQTCALPDRHEIRQAVGEHQPPENRTNASDDVKQRTEKHIAQVFSRDDSSASHVVAPSNLFCDSSLVVSFKKTSSRRSEERRVGKSGNVRGR